MCKSVCHWSHQQIFSHNCYKTFIWYQNSSCAAGKQYKAAQDWVVMVYVSCNYDNKCHICFSYAKVWRYSCVLLRRCLMLHIHLPQCSVLEICLVEHNCSVVYCQHDPAAPTEGCFGATFPYEMVERLVYVLRSTMQALLKQTVISRRGKYGFDGFHDVWRKCIFVRATTIRLLGWAPGTTAVMLSVAVLPDGPHSLLHSW